jgi:hypothetical protein
VLYIESSVSENPIRRKPSCREYPFSAVAE